MLRQNLLNASENVDRQHTVVRRLLLSRYYPEIRTLHQFLAHVVRGSRVVLVQPDDPPDYVRLLDTVLVARTKAAPALLTVGFEQAASQPEVVDRVIQALVLHGPTVKRHQQQHVLALGFGKQLHRHSHGLRHVYGVEAFFPNTTVNEVKGPPWPRLLSRIGDAVMAYLLQHTTLFRRLGTSDCYMQLTGMPLSLHVKRTDLHPPLPVAAAAPRGLFAAGSSSSMGRRLPAAARRRRRQAVDSDEQKPVAATTTAAAESAARQSAETTAGGAAAGSPRAAAEGPRGAKRPHRALSPIDHHSRAADLLDSSGTTTSDGDQPQEAAPAAKKRPRLSSWRRKRLKAQQQEEGAAAATLAEAADGMTDAPAAAVDRKRKRAIADPAEEQPVQQQPPVPREGPQQPKRLQQEQHHDEECRQDLLQQQEEEEEEAPSRHQQQQRQQPQQQGKPPQAQRPARAAFLRPAPRPLARSYLPRAAVLYCRRRRPPRDVPPVLAGAQATVDGARRLLYELFVLAPTDLLLVLLVDPARRLRPAAVAPAKFTLPRRLRSLIDPMRRLIRNAQRCPYYYLLARHCPLLLPLVPDGHASLRSQPTTSSSDGPWTAPPHAIATASTLPDSSGGGVDGGTGNHSSVASDQRAAAAETGAAPPAQQKHQAEPGSEPRRDGSRRGGGGDSRGAGMATADGQQAFVESDFHDDDDDDDEEEDREAAVFEALRDSGIDWDADLLMTDDAPAQGDDTGCQAEERQRTEDHPSPAHAAGPVAVDVPDAIDAAAPSVPLLAAAFRAAGHAGGGSNVSGSTSSSGSSGSSGRRMHDWLETALLPELLRSWTPQPRVAHLLRSLIRRIVPRTFWGSATNFEAFSANLRRFVQLRRFERFSVQEAMRGIKVSQCAWAHAAEPLRGDRSTAAQSRPPLREVALRQRLVEMFVAWVFTALVIPLTRTLFYCTESSGQRNKIFYYRRVVWDRVERSVRRNLHSSLFRRLSKTEAAGVLGRRAFGFSYVRLLPKASSVRPILNFGRKLKLPPFRQQQQSRSFASAPPPLVRNGSGDAETVVRGGGAASEAAMATAEPPGQQQAAQQQQQQQAAPVAAAAEPAVEADDVVTTSINGQLRNTFEVLKYELMNEQQQQQQQQQRGGAGGSDRTGAGAGAGVFGASIFGFDELYAKVVPFITHWRRLSPRPPALYFATTDVKASFDSIDQSKLYDILMTAGSSLLSEDQYLVQKYTVLQQLGGRGPCLRYMRTVWPLRAFPQFAEFAADLAARGVYRRAVITDQVVYAIEEQQTIKQLLEEIIFHNLVKDGGAFYEQRQGIAQGSVLSSLLCSIFYAHLERTHLSRLPQALPRVPSILSPPPLLPGGGAAPARPLSVSAAASGAARSPGARLAVGLYSPPPPPPPPPAAPSSSLAATHRGPPPPPPPPPPRRPAPRLPPSPQLSPLPRARSRTPLAVSVNSSSADSSSSSTTSTGSTNSGGGGAGIHGGSANRSPAHFPGLAAAAAAAVTAADDDIASSSSPNAYGLLMRFVDDFFYVTTDLDAAGEFVRLMERGVPDYGCTANASKTRLSFDLDAARNSRSCYKAADGTLFIAWCGFLINTRTFEFQVDYSRYHGDSIRDSLCVERSENPGDQLLRKMCKCLRYKCHPLTLDAQINSMFVIRLNVYQAFLFCAMRLCCYIDDMPRGAQHNPAFYAEVVLRLVEYMYSAVRQCTGGGTASLAARLGCNCPLIAAEVKWLGLHAFHSILERRQTKMRPVLKMLTSTMMQPRYDYYRRNLKDVVNPSHSSIFDKIIF